MNESNFINWVKLLAYDFVDNKRFHDDHVAYKKRITNSLKNYDCTEKEIEKIINHFNKQIFPIDIQTLQWCLNNLRKEEIRYKTKLNEMKKLKHV